MHSLCFYAKSNLASFIFLKSLILHYTQDEYYTPQDEVVTDENKENKSEEEEVFDSNLSIPKSPEWGLSANKELW